MLRVGLLRQALALSKHRFKSAEETKVDVDVHTKKLHGETIFSPTRSNKPVDIGAKKYQVLSLDDADWKYLHDESTFHMVPGLQHGLEAVLEGGIHKSDFGLGEIPHHLQIDESQFTPYFLPSNDTKSINHALKHKMKYLMSTSTITSIMSHIYFIYSQFRVPTYDNIRPDLVSITKNYMISFRKPVTSIITKLDNGLIVIDSDNKFYEDSPTVLMKGGKIMESMVTETKEGFQQRFLKKGDKSHIPPLFDHHNYLHLNNEVCIRSQIDCKAVDSNGKTYFFEIKTRSAAPIRYDFENYEDYLNYAITKRGGTAESFQREYYDLIRGSFMTYGFQILIGGMQGAVVAYHNTTKFFGFQYITADEMYKRIFGDRRNCEYALMICSKILTKIVNHIYGLFKNQSYKHIRMGLYADNSFNGQLNVFAQTLDQLPKDFQQGNQQTISDSIDYYNKCKPIKKVLKFNMLLKIIVNGVEQPGSGINLGEDDHIQVKYHFGQAIEPTFDQYMIFLHESEKRKDDLRSQYYNGIWYNRS